MIDNSNSNTNSKHKNEDSKSKSNTKNRSSLENINLVIENFNPNDNLLAGSTHPNFGKLIELPQIFDSFSNKNVSETFELFRDCLYYQTDILKESIQLIKEYLNNLINSFNKITEENSKMEICELLEKLTYLFLFHYHLEITNLGLKMLNLLITETDPEFHKETLQKFIKILHILKVKKSVNSQVCTKIISNISQGIILIINKTTHQETRKVLLDFVTNNYEDYIFMWILCGNCNSEVNFSKFYSVESICSLIEKNCKEFDKQNKVLESSIINLKTERSLALKNKVKQIVDIIACISKLIDGFTISGSASKTYNYDKVVKSSLIPSVKKFWNLLLFVQEDVFYEIDFSVESIQTIMNLTYNINSLSFDFLLPLLNWTSILLDKNLKYIANLRLIIKFLSKCEIPKETGSEVISAVLDIVEKILLSAKEKFPQIYKDPVFTYYIILIIDNLESFPENPQLVIKDELKLTQMLYLSIKEDKLIEQDQAQNQVQVQDQNNNSPMKMTNNEIFIKAYKDLTSPPVNPILSNNGGFRKPTIKALQPKTNPNNTNPFFKSLNESLKKYEDFKNSLKSAYNLDCYDLLVDNKISNFKENEKLNNPDTGITEISQMYENFYLESTIEMYREIFNKK